ncbi:discoidin domain-containing protein [Aestuariibacter sp. AA17]|uniref:Discoidin domain-containing protein n=1 Tax=Fluctibacter corallii TaxID=2984329 RepID=A0ABT3AA86_9ALTE|nr:discoidin domain-containing protein [Aestuariibacter sp. AA17]MCV2885519.1 discoidin domain-containing protein [Aestuariibacter sp. AA17]
MNNQTITHPSLVRIPAMLLTGFLAACGGGGNDPTPTDVPFQPESTHATITGSVVKGPVYAASLNISTLNNSTLTIASGGETLNDGSFSIALQSEPGFGINSIIALTAEANDNTVVVCDAAQCGDRTIGESLSAAQVGNLSLTTLSHVAVDYNNSAGGSTNATVQLNALTTLATTLIQRAIDNGQNVSSSALLEIAQQDASSLLLRVFGWQTNSVNLFDEAVVDAQSYEKFVTSEQCNETQSTDESGDPVSELVCHDVLLGENIIKLSLINASLAAFPEGKTLSEHIQDTQQHILNALNDDKDALKTLREGTLAAIENHPALSQLGMTAADIIDLSLSLEESTGTSGPLTEVTSQENVATATVEARNSISDAENASKVFDGDVNTKWLDHNDYKGAPSEADPSWVQITFNEPQAANTLLITSANDSPERDPENVTVQASNNGESWVELAKITGIAFNERFERQAFTFANQLAYQTYRINITKNQGNTDLMQIADIQLLGPVFVGKRHTDTTSYTSTARYSISDAENQDKVFDGNPDTKWLDHNDWQGAPSDANPAWLQVDFAQPVAVDTLAITSANDAPERDPENFSLLASNDNGTTWTSIGDWVGESFDDRLSRKSWPVSNQLAYTSYRLEVSKNQGNADLMQIGEIELIGPEVAGENHALSSGASYTARFSISDSESAAQAFDSNSDTKWLDHNDWQGAPSDSDPAWIQVDLPEAKTVNTLTITSANDAPARDPENFSLLGSNDGGTSWTTLASWTGESFNERFEQQSWAINNTLAYATYRLAVSKNAGNDGLMQIAEVGLIGPQYESIDHSDKTGSSYTARFSISDNESAAQAFDNNPETKWLDHNDWQGAPSEADPSWIQVDLAEPTVIDTLAITSANDAPERDPEDFSLLGSNDGGQTWEPIANWVGESWNDRFERRVFSFTNGFAYTSYRVSISKTNADLVQIGEIELIGLNK